LFFILLSIDSRRTAGFADARVVYPVVTKIECEVRVTVIQYSCTFLSIPSNWSGNWAWGLPLIVLTVVIHVLGLGVIRQTVSRVFEGGTNYHQSAVFAAALGATTLLATMLHGIEAGIWAVTYRILGALPDSKTAMLYSLNAITSYGHTEVDLASHWHLMGALEALNGWLLFGLTTAFLFAVIEQFGPVGNHKH
jgi:hypothetical protein